MFEVQNKVTPNRGNIPPISPILFMKILNVYGDLTSIYNLYIILLIMTEILYIYLYFKSILNDLIYLFIDVNILIKYVLYLTSFDIMPEV